MSIQYIFILYQSILLLYLFLQFMLYGISFATSCANVSFIYVLKIRNRRKVIPKYANPMGMINSWTNVQRPFPDHASNTKQKLFKTIGSASGSILFHGNSTDVFFLKWYQLVNICAKTIGNFFGFLFKVVWTRKHMCNNYWEFFDKFQKKKKNWTIFLQDL